MVDGQSPVTKRGFLIVRIDTGEVQHILTLNEDIKTWRSVIYILTDIFLIEI